MGIMMARKPVISAALDGSEEVAEFQCSAMLGDLHLRLTPRLAKGYRIDEPATGACAVVATDVEWAAMTSRAQDAFAAFARGADLLAFDAQYRPDEYAAHRGWGHSTWADAVEAARRCGAAKLWLIHHAPGRTDAEIDALAAEAAAAFKGAVVPAGERMTETLHE